jgi:UDP-glucose 4-epimerase
MRVLVTGGCGFIGSSLVLKLVKLGYDVYVIDNFTTGSKNNILDVKNEIHFLEGDVKNIEKYEIPPIDVIFHYGIYSPLPVASEKLKLFFGAIEDAIALLEFAKKNKSKVIIASSASVYSGLPLPWKEDMPPQVIDYYTESRVAIERLAELYHKLFGIPVIIFRLFSVYGPREESKGILASSISQFIWKMIKNKSPIIYGSGEQTKDFIYIDDVVNANIRAIEKVNFGIFNLASGKQTSLNEIVELINQKLQKKIKPIYLPTSTSKYGTHMMGDIKKCKEILGFKPKIDVLRGIELTINYYKKYFISSNYD